MAQLFQHRVDLSVQLAQQAQLVPQVQHQVQVQQALQA